MKAASCLCGELDLMETAGSMNDDGNYLKYCFAASNIAYCLNLYLL
jgi:hypothetical protein